MSAQIDRSQVDDVSDLLALLWRLSGEEQTRFTLALIENFEPEDASYLRAVAKALAERGVRATDREGFRRAVLEASIGPPPSKTSQSVPDDTPVEDFFNFDLFADDGGGNSAREPD